MLFAKALASSIVFIKAPEPTFTSKQKASVPSATFFERMLEVISGIDSTVPETSRKAYKSLSAGTTLSVCPIIEKPQVSIVFLNSSTVKFVRYPSIDSNLSRVPPVYPKARPAIIGTLSPCDATMAAKGSEILSPTPPVECLSTKISSFFLMEDKSIFSPE